MDDESLVGKIGVVSDTHENPKALEELICCREDISIWIHCGDGIDHCIYMKELFKNKKFFFIRGNCDHLTELYELWQEFGKILFWVTHGHREKVKHSLKELAFTARTGEAQVVLFGHTHRSAQIEEDGILFLNPGSLQDAGTYITLEISEKKLREIRLERIEKIEYF